MFLQLSIDIPFTTDLLHTKFKPSANTTPVQEKVLENFDFDLGSSFGIFLIFIF